MLELLAIPPRASARWTYARANLWPDGIDVIALAQDDRWAWVLPNEKVGRAWLDTAVVLGPQGKASVLVGRPSSLIPIEGAPVILDIEVDEAAFRPDGRRFVGSQMFSVSVFDSLTGETLKTRRLLEQSQSSEAIRWTAQAILVDFGSEWVVLHPDTLDTVVAHASFPSVDGDFVVKEFGDSIQVLDTSSGKERLRYPMGEHATHGVTTADGRYIARGLTSTLDIFDTMTRRRWTALRHSLQSRPKHTKHDFLLTVDGRYLCQPNWQSGHVFDLRSNREVDWQQAASQNRDVRCTIHEGRAVVFDTPLRSNEAVAPSEPIFFSDDDRWAALVAWDPNPLHYPAFSLLVIDLKQPSQVRRVGLPSALSTPYLEFVGPDLFAAVHGGQRIYVSWSQARVIPNPSPRALGKPQSMRLPRALTEGYKNIIPKGEALVVEHRAHTEAFHLNTSHSITESRQCKPRLAQGEAGLVSYCREREQLRFQPFGKDSPLEWKIPSLIDYAANETGLVAFSRGDRTIRILDRKTRTDFAPPLDAAHCLSSTDCRKGPFVDLVWSPSGKFLAAWHERSRQLIAIEVANGKVHSAFSSPDNPSGPRLDLGTETLFEIVGEPRWRRRRAPLFDRSSFPPLYGLSDGSRRYPGLQYFDGPVTAPIVLMPPFVGSSIGDASYLEPHNLLVATTAQAGRVYDATTGAVQATFLAGDEEGLVFFMADGKVDLLGQESSSLASALLCLEDGSHFIDPSVCESQVVLGEWGSYFSSRRRPPKCP